MRFSNQRSRVVISLMDTGVCSAAPCDKRDGRVTDAPRKFQSRCAFVEQVLAAPAEQLRPLFIEVGVNARHFQCDETV